MKDINAGGSQPVPGSIHTSTAGTSSIPSNALVGISNKLQVNTFSGISTNTILGAWSLCLELGKDENVELVVRAWQYILCVVGDVVQHKKAAPFRIQHLDSESSSTVSNPESIQQL